LPVPALDFTGLWAPKHIGTLDKTRQGRVDWYFVTSYSTKVVLCRANCYERGTGTLVLCTEDTCRYDERICQAFRTLVCHSMNRSRMVDSVFPQIIFVLRRTLTSHRMLHYNPLFASLIFATGILANYEDTRHFMIQCSVQGCLTAQTSTSSSEYGSKSVWPHLMDHH
jgi:hypothetical protein